MFSKSATRSPSPTIWSTNGLRYGAAFAALFALGVTGLVAGIDYGMMRFAEHEVRDGLSHQMHVMQHDANRHGTAQLVQELNADHHNRDARRYLLLVEAPDGSTFSSGLTRQAVNDSGFRRNLPSKAKPARWPDQTPNMLVLSAHAEDGGLLAVGRDIQHLDDLRGGIHRYALISGVILVLLTLSGGLIAGRLFLHRLEAVNQTVDRIIAGQDSARLPEKGLGREFNQLSLNLNRMLDRQETALTTLKTLSEGVAHELRAPLNRIRNRLEVLAANIDDPEARDDAIEKAVEETDQVSALFEALLTLARIESGDTVLHTQAQDVTALTGNVAHIYGPFVEEAGGQLTTDLQPSAMVELDVNLFQQALANLVENAVYHGGADIRISTRLENAQAVIEVSDRGAGIPQSEHEKVLRRFYRRDQAPLHHANGAGLGLAMVAAVVKAHKGQLHLGDNQPGLKVSIHLPPLKTL